MAGEDGAEAYDESFGCFRQRIIKDRNCDFLGGNTVGKVNVEGGGRIILARGRCAVKGIHAESHFAIAAVDPFYRQRDCAGRLKDARCAAGKTNLAGGKGPQGQTGGAERFDNIDHLNRTRAIAGCSATAEHRCDLAGWGGCGLSSSVCILAIQRPQRQRSQSTHLWGGKGRANPVTKAGVGGDLLLVDHADQAAGWIGHTLLRGRAGAIAVRTVTRRGKEFAVV